MRILYRNPENKNLSVTEITSTSYSPEEQSLTFFGDEDICIPADRGTADQLTKTLFLEGRLDISMYDCEICEWPDDEEDEEDEDFVIAPDFFLDL